MRVTSGNGVYFFTSVARFWDLTSENRDRQRGNGGTRNMAWCCEAYVMPRALNGGGNRFTESIKLIQMEEMYWRLIFLCSSPDPASFSVSKVKPDVIWCREEQQSISFVLGSLRFIKWSLYVPHSGHYMYRQFNIQQFYVLATQLYLCVLCGSQNKQPLFPYTTLTDWFL